MCFTLKTRKKDFLNLLILFFFVGIVLSQTKSASSLNKEIEEIGSYEIIKDSIPKKGSIVPVPMPITDENIGYGGILGIAYMHDNKNSNRPKTPQTITGIAGGATSTGSWLVSVFHSQAFNDDKIRYDGMVGYADMFLNFYVLEKIDRLKFPIATNLTFWGTQHQLLFRFGQSNFFIGPQYRFMKLNGGINLELSDPDYGELSHLFSFNETVSAIALLGDYDSRDHVLSPNTGYYTGFFLRKNASWLGATRDYIWSEIYGYAYYSISKGLHTILKLDFQYAGDNTPFYAKPYIELRGAPAMRYQGNIVSTFENQWRVNLFGSFSMVAFAGVGKAYNSFDGFDESKWVYNYGTGIRYTLKKVDNLRVGVDFGWSNEDFAWGISLGTGL